MLVKRILKVVLLLLGGVFVLLQGLAYELEAMAVGSVVLLLLSLLYWRWSSENTKYFKGFLLTFTFAQILAFLSFFFVESLTEQIDYMLYFVTNSIFILAYVFLILKITSKLDFRVIFSEFKMSIVVLVILDVFCVSIVTGTTSDVLSLPEYTLEFIYNAIIMTLLSVALLNYMYRNDNKSMLFLIGSIFIVFSEIIQLAYFYVLVDSNNLGFIYSLFLVVAFLFFYIQSQLESTGPAPNYIEESL